MGPAVDNPDDVPKADAQVGGGSRRSRNLHGSTVARIVAPVEDILCWDRDISQSQLLLLELVMMALLTLSFRSGTHIQSLKMYYSLHSYVTVDGTPPGKQSRSTMHLDNFCRTGMRRRCAYAAFCAAP